MSDGSRDVCLDREEWCAFMVRYGLGGNCGSESCAELTDAHIHVKPSYEFIQTLQTTINGYNPNPSDVDCIHIVHGGDHGKNKFRFVSKLIVSMKNGKLYSQVFGLADVACRKDHAIILENICMPLIMKGINTIEASDIVFSYASNTDDGELVIDLDQTNRHASSFSIKPLSFLAGDLAFLAVIMGKENLRLYWCN